MTKEQQRIAIAKSCGWTDCVFVESIKLAKGFPPPNNPPSYGTYENGMAQLPNYLKDLNAMHEAENVLTKVQRREYVRTLFQTTNTDWDSHCATAAQRADAFLKTIGKWEEAQ